MPVISRGLLNILAIPFLFSPKIPLPADGFESVEGASLLGEGRAQRGHDGYWKAAVSTW